MSRRVLLAAGIGDKDIWQYEGRGTGLVKVPKEQGSSRARPSFVQLLQAWGSGLHKRTRS